MLRRFAFSLLLALPAQAEPLKIVTDILPVHALTAQVQAPDAALTLIMPPSASQHDFALKPSTARALSEADIVIRMGPAMLPGLEDAISTLAPNALQVILMDVDGTVIHAARESVSFDDDHHDHGHGHGHGDKTEHAHEADHAADHDDTHAGHKGHDDHAAHDDHDDHDDHKDHETHAHHDDHGDDHGDDHAENDGHGDGHGHGHDHVAGGADPHAWLDPQNAITWTKAIATALASRDPAQAEAYQARAAAAADDIAAMTGAITEQLAPYKDMPYVVQHDAYQYFERAFDLVASGAISPSDATPPSAARVAALQDAAVKPVCIFAEPQFDLSRVETLAQGLGARVGVLDPIGADVSPGPDAYGAVLRGLADGLATCLGGSS